MGTLPGRKLEVMLGGSWVDLSPYLLQGHTITRGRASESAQPSVGVATFRLRNAAGRFDPSNTSGPYAGLLLPLRPVRYTALLPSGGTSLRFVGRCLGWPQQWGKGGRFGTVELSCTDGLRDLTAYTYPAAYADGIMDDGPRYFFRMAEIKAGPSSPEQTQNADSSTDTASPVRLTLQSPVPAVVPGLVLGSGNGALRFTTGGGSTRSFGRVTRTQDSGSGTATSNYPTITFTGDFTVELLARPDSVPTTSTESYALATRIGNTSGAVYGAIAATFGATASAARWNFSVMNAAATGSDIIGTSSTIIPTAGRTDHLVLRRTGSNLAAFINGTQVASITRTGEVTFASLGSVLHIGDTGTTATGTSLTVDEAAFYDYAVPDPRLAERQTVRATRAQYEPQTVAQRVDAILNTVGWTAGRNITTSGRLVSESGNLKDRTALDVLQDAVGVDLGSVLVDRTGSLVTLDRPTLGLAAYVLGDGPGEMPYLGDLSIDFDDQSIVNLVTVSSSNTMPVLQAKTSDPTSISTYGPTPRAAQHNAPFATQSDVDTAAAYLLSRGKDPLPRVDRLTLDVAANPANETAYSGLANGMVVEVRRRPPGAPQITLTCIVEQIREVGDDNSLRLELQLSPAPMALTDFEEADFEINDFN